MTKYELWKETQIEMRRRPVDYTVADPEKFSFNRIEPIARYDTMEEARAAFEDEKQYCRTYSTSSNVFPLILFDELRLMEVNYDDDGELSDAECWGNYIADDKCLIFEEEGE